MIDSTFDCSEFTSLVPYLEQEKVLVQIGTNDGKDTFNKIVKYVSPSKVILVEPNKTLNKEIRDCYADIPNVFIENVAITERNEKFVKLMIPKRIVKYGKDGRHKKTVNGIKYISGCYSMLPMDNWGTVFESFKATTMTFTNLCKKHNLTHIHFLMIDTEGYDCEIIKTIDFSKIKIDIIQYEKWDFPVESFTRYGEKGKQYGVAGMKYVAELLTKQGYRFEEKEWDIIAIKND